MSDRRSFLDHLVQWRGDVRVPFIAEIKPRSAAGLDLLRERSVAELVAAYEAARVACISVVTGAWFGGTQDLLVQVVRETQLPVLQKDFVVTRGAVKRAYELGARAVLLTQQLLTPDGLRALVDYALTLELTPFVEVSSKQELDGLRLDARAILAVNNRDIRTRETTGDGVARSLELLALARATGAGAVVSASGIETPRDAAQLMSAGFDGLLIGTALLAGLELRQGLQEFHSAVAGAGAHQ
jgi:indole-3-glycerol phosphate synthase